MKGNLSSDLTPAYFTNDQRVQKCIDDLKAKFGNDMKGLVVSDTLDAEGNQYVELIQKGGGVWGVALVGYTYILEEAGIRFLKLAGTSAGAINTAMMGMIGENSTENGEIHHKSGKKSPIILDYISKLDMFNFVDGHPFAKWLIEKFIKNKNFVPMVLRFVKSMVFSLIGLLFFNTLFLGLSHVYEWADAAVKTTFVLTGIVFFLIAVVSIYLFYMSKRLKGCGYGINPGSYFYDWIKEKMEQNGVHTIADLNNKMAIPIPGIKLRVSDHPQGVSGLTGDISIITSELVTENKVEFPKMWDLFKVNEDELHPARFVRSSMSIPVFFESHTIIDIPKETPGIQAAWKKHFGVTDVKNIPDNVRFVDGGMLSNFPVNIFYNPRVIEPRLPSFGIDMTDVKVTAPGQKEVDDIYSWGLEDYLGRMLNTMRNYYDKDFMLKNNVFAKGIGKINLHGFNWLNFFVSNEDKREMFVKGAEAAKDFLINFDWQEYKRERIEMQELLKNN